MATRPYCDPCEPGHGVRYELARGAGVTCADFTGLSVRSQWLGELASRRH
jgi:hypothetical protein